MSARIKKEPRDEGHPDTMMGGTPEAEGAVAALQIKEEPRVKEEEEAKVTITGSREMSVRDLILDAQARNLPRQKLFYIRRQFQNIHAKTKAAGPGTLSNETAAKLKEHLKELSWYDFTKDKDDFRLTKIDKALKYLCDVSLYGDEIGEKAKKIHARWMGGHWEPFNLSEDEDDLSDDLGSSDFAETSDEHVTPEPTAQSTSNGQCDPTRTTTGHIMRGIEITRSGGRKTQKLDPSYPKRDAKVYGHNGCCVGDWWPFQLNALRDGAHGARIGGITPGQHGAYSVVISGGTYDEQDFDYGDEVWYSGSMGADDEGSRRAAQKTPGVRALMKNEKNGRPIRVIRSGKATTRHAPSYGYRYDGLYRVTEHRIKKAQDGRYFYQFHLIRREDQPPIDHNRPNPGEKRAYSVLTT